MEEAVRVKKCRRVRERERESDSLGTRFLSLIVVEEWGDFSATERRELRLANHVHA